MKDFFNQIDKNKLPQHIAIIMDGNGRWAKNKNMPRAYGHKNGVKSALSISELCAKLGVKYLTLYTLSLENLLRPKLEINSLKLLLSNSIKNELQKMKENNIKFKVIGFREKLSKKINNQLDSAILETSNNNGLTLTLALAYSSRQEIVNCSKLIANKVINNEIDIDNINIETINENLLTNNIPDPDLLIRTGNTHRLSNFLLWQLAYSEIFFEKKLWPDFNVIDYNNVLIKFKKIKRNYGNI